MRVSSLEVADISIERDISSDIDKVRVVADNIGSVNVVKGAIDDGTLAKAAEVATNPLKANVNTVANISVSITAAAAISTEIEQVANIRTQVAAVAADPLKTAILNAETNANTATTKATESQQEAWNAQAQRLTADSYATEDEDTPVKIYTSDNDGTFSYASTSPVEYSAKHWRNKAQSIAGGSIDALSDVDASNKSTNSLLAWNGTDNYVNKTLAQLDIATDTDLDNHTGNTSNPHSVTASQVGLGNVDNTSDSDKPVSTAAQTALNSKANDSDVVKLTGNQTIAGKKEFTGLIQFSKGSDVSSASALTLGSDGNYFDVTGTTTITSINTSGRVGTVIKLHFDAILTITHNATDLVLPGNSDIVTSVGDEAEFIEYSSGDWRCVNYQKSNGKPIVGSLDLSKSLTVGTSISISSWSYSGTTITINTSNSHGLVAGDSIRIQGLVATTNVPNGIQSVVSVMDSDTFTFTASSTPTGTASGSGSVYVGAITANNRFIGKNVCTAWVVVDTTTTPTTIKDSFNVKDVVRSSTGRFQLVHEMAYVNTDRVVVGAGETNDSGSGAYVISKSSVRNNTTTVTEVFIKSSTTAGPINPNDAMIVIYGGN